MTEHLQHIDLELDLLKRKREMIEQQQELLETQMLHREKSLNYDSPRYFERASFQNANNVDSDYTRYYDESVGSGDFIPLNSRKRSYQPDWETNPNKRFSSNARGSDSQFNFRSGRRSANRFQGQGSSKRQPAAEPQFSNKGPGRSSTDRPKSGKVTKAKTSLPPNKLNTYSISERNNLVKKTTSAAKKVDESLILRPNCPMSNQLQGRLELVMGHLLKELKTKFSEVEAYRDTIQSPLAQRTVKQILRDRIKELMMNKYIGGINDGLTVYRKRYPEGTDEALLEEVKQAKEELNVKNPDNKLIQSDDPEAFLEKNLEKLIHSKLVEMFGKLDQIYKKKKEQKPVPVTAEVDLTKDVDVPENEKKEENKAECEEVVPIKNIENVLPQLMIRFIPRIVKLLNANKAFEASKAFLIQLANTKAVNLATKTKTVEKTSEKSTTENHEAAAPAEPPKYFVQILGKPVLPKRKIMQAFLDKFNPRSVKRHKRIRNLLFVGFVTEEQVDKIISEDGHVMGKTTLGIRKSERTNQSQNNDEEDDVELIEPEEEVIELNKTIDSDIIGSELDHQINDLLTSIREAEEKVQMDTNPKQTVDANINKEGDEVTINDNLNENDATATDATATDATASDATATDATATDTTATDATNVDDNITEDSTKESTLAAVCADSVIEDDVKSTDINEDDTNKTEDEEDKETNLEEPDETADTATPDTEIKVPVEKNDDCVVAPETTADKPVSELPNENKTVDTENNDESKANEQTGDMAEEAKDVISNLKSEVPATPTRSSARIANTTPNTIRTRRTSRLAAANEKP